MDRTGLTDVERLIVSLGLRPISGGRLSPEPGSEAGPEPAPATEPEPVPEAAPAQEPVAAAPSFMRKEDLPQELWPAWTKMHGAYTKALEKTRGATEKAAAVDRFWADPAYARQSIEQWAQQNGVTISFDQSSPRPAPTPASGSQAVPPELVAAIEAELPQELHWMARALAASTWKAQGQMLAPMLRDSRQKEASQRQAEWDDLAAELAEVAPGWEAHEDDMTALLEFLKGSELRSRRWGNKLELLHRMVTGEATATRNAVRRIGEAARNRTTTGQPGRATTTNLADRIRQAKTDQEAWQIAGQHAVETLQRAGAGAS